MKKNYYGVRYLGGNGTCTNGSANPLTGHYSILVSIEVFRSELELDEWIANEILHSPSGLGGERTKKMCRKTYLGELVEDFENYSNKGECPA